jgi:Peptidase family C25/Propeptide_C25
MKNTIQTKLIIGGIFVLFLVMGVSPGLATIGIQKLDSLEFSVTFTAPVLKEYNGWSDITIPETNGMMSDDGCPQLPVFSKTFEFPLGAKIISVEIQPSTIYTMSVAKQVRPAPSKQKIGDQIVPVEGIIKEAVYASADAYPASWYTCTSGAGLNDNNDHTLFFTIHLTPARYSPGHQFLQYSTSFTIRIIYDPVMPTPLSTDSYSLVIITPSNYSSLLQPLVDHKIASGVPTKLVTLDEIYSSYIGRDNPEKIKYFIKYAIEKWDTQYVLLVGDIKTLPIRTTYASWWEPNLLSDQYYADIYDAQGHFCSWDANANDRFGEINSQGDDIDGVDLYADVHVGRLACTDATEVTTVVNKIITYEEETYNQIWFKRIVLAGGDTFPPCRGAPPFVYEGEITNTKVGQALPDFDQTYLWTSKHNLHAGSFNRAITQGAGFVSYAGHGFEHGWSTYRPNAISSKTPIWYFTPYIDGLKNGNKLPIIFFDACLTAKLDFNFTDLEGYFHSTVHLITRLFHLSEDPSVFYPCFAWYFLQKTDGGAVATIGSTRTAYTWVDSNGVYGGAGYLDVHFFMAYHEGTNLGPMLTSSQNDYINNVEKDYFTIEEFMLLGDPSLMVGGYQ